MLRSLIDELVVDPAFAIALALAGALAPVLVNVGSIPSWLESIQKPAAPRLKRGGPGAQGGSRAALEIPFWDSRAA